MLEEQLSREDRKNKKGVKTQIEMGRKKIQIKIYKENIYRQNCSNK